MTSSDHPSDQSQQDTQKKRPRFWVGPLVAGCCFSLGFGITQRTLTVQSNAETPSPESFAAVAFPGESLQALRDLHGQQAEGIQVDVAAMEAKREAERKAKEEAERIAEAAMERDRSQQALLNTPRPLEDMATLNEATLFETAMSTPHANIGTQDMFKPTHTA